MAGKAYADNLNHCNSDGVFRNHTRSLEISAYRRQTYSTIATRIPHRKNERHSTGANQVGDDRPEASRSRSVPKIYAINNRKGAQQSASKIRARKNCFDWDMSLQISPHAPSPFTCADTAFSSCFTGGRVDAAFPDQTSRHTRQCAVDVNARDLAVMAATLADNGRNPVTHKQVTSPEHVPQLLAVMATAGLYDDSGQWLFTTGLPAKSGVGGGILAVSPGKFGIAVISPRWIRRATVSAPIRRSMISRIGCTEIRMSGKWRH